MFTTIITLTSLHFTSKSSQTKLAEDTDRDQCRILAGCYSMLCCRCSFPLRLDPRWPQRPTTQHLRGILGMFWTTSLQTSILSLQHRRLKNHGRLLSFAHSPPNFQEPPRPDLQDERGGRTRTLRRWGLASWLEILTGFQPVFFQAATRVYWLCFCRFRRRLFSQRMQRCLK